MTISRKTLLALGLALAGSQLTAVAPAMAQAVKGIAVANPTAIVVSSNAFKTAEQQRPVTYKAQFDQANARKTAIEAQLRPLATKLEADAKAASPNQSALQQQYNQIQQIEAAGQQEINQILGPIALSRAYVLEQIQDKLGQATDQAMAKQKITLLIDSQNVLDADQAYNLNQPILNELNTLIPTAQLVPPANWVPRAQREAQAQAQQQPGAPAASAPKPPAGR
ncbi:MAG: OmpH family outer membrane protein [Novosphingobium sp.]